MSDSYQISLSENISSRANAFTRGVAGIGGVVVQAGKMVGKFLAVLTTLNMSAGMDAALSFRGIALDTIGFVRCLKLAADAFQSCVADSAPKEKSNRDGWKTLKGVVVKGSLQSTDKRIIKETGVRLDLRAYWDKSLFREETKKAYGALQPTIKNRGYTVLDSTKSFDPQKLIPRRRPQKQTNNV